jgi:hypothetical protein
VPDIEFSVLLAIITGWPLVQAKPASTVRVFVPVPIVKLVDDDVE